jgi:hypothetical protein
MKLTATLFFLGLFSSFALFGQTEKSIYGEDNRRLVREISDEFILKYSPSILAQIPSWRITTQTKSQISIKTKTLKTGLNFCADEKFLDEPIVSSCTAFLVAPDLILTAGHCLKDKFDCKKNIWVLDFDNSGDAIYDNEAISFPSEKVYQCQQLVAHVENSKLDYALVKLDRAILDRSLLKINNSPKTDSKEPLIIIGHPLGMSKIATDQIYIRDNSLEYVFKTNADTFSGNSGSPAIGVNSGLVEGILIRGDEDFYLDQKTNCNRSYRCNNTDCRGETLLRSSFLPLKNIPRP